MNLQEMTENTLELDHSAMDSTFSAMNIIPDQSADIFAAVLGHNMLLPDDQESIMNDRISFRQHKHTPAGKTRLSEKAKALLAKRRLALLQEEHALWLK